MDNESVPLTKTVRHHAIRRAPRSTVLKRIHSLETYEDVMEKENQYKNSMTSALTTLKYAKVTLVKELDFKQEGRSITSLSCSKKVLYVSDVCGNLKSYDIKEFTNESSHNHSYNHPSKSITKVVVTGDDKYVFLAANFGEQKQFKITSELFFTYRYHNVFGDGMTGENIKGVCGSNDGKYLYLISSKGDLKKVTVQETFDKEKKNQIITDFGSGGHRSKGKSIFCTDNKLITSSMNGSLCDFNIETEEHIQEIVEERSNEYISCITVDTSRDFLWSGYSSGKVTVYCLKKREQLQDFKRLHCTTCEAIVITKDFEYVFASGQSSKIIQFSAAELKVITFIKWDHSWNITNLEVDKESKFLFSGNNLGMIAKWKIGDKELQIEEKRSFLSGQFTVCRQATIKVGDDIEQKKQEHNQRIVKMHHEQKDLSGKENKNTESIQELDEKTNLLYIKIANINQTVGDLDLKLGSQLEKLKKMVLKAN